MKRHLIMVPLFCYCAVTVYTRVWTDIQGHTVEAKMVDADGDDQIVNLRGNQTVIEQPFPDSVAKQLKDKGKTHFKLAIGVPAGFDPAKPMKVFIVSTAGNIAQFKMYAGSCAEQGWAGIAADFHKGFLSSAHAISHAFKLLTAVWPGFATATFAGGGFSGGSKACFFNAAWLVKNKYNITRAFLGRCNHDTSERKPMRPEQHRRQGHGVHYFWA